MLRASFLFLLLIFSGCASQRPAQLTNTPQTWQGPVDLYLWDFKEVKENEIVRHAFMIKNDSGRQMLIKNVSSSCGCTVSKVKKDKLAPGESTLVEVAFNSKGYSGPVQQYVYVVTDSPDTPILKFTIRALVVK